ncbi:MAG: helix-hairpin-helix domain-containing protein [Myxococcota bacterium]
MSKFAFRSSLSALAAVLFLAFAMPSVASARPKSPPVPSAQPSTTAEGVVNINTAGLAELMRLPRVGPSLAERIVDYRSRTPFKRTVELARVKGIGLKSVRRLSPWLTIAGPTTLTRKLVLPRQTPAESGTGGGDSAESE